MGEVIEAALGGAVERAQGALLNLVVVMRAYRIPRDQLGLVLPAGWPEPVRKTFDEAMGQLIPVAKLLALADGIERWPELPELEKAKFLGRAYERVMDSPAPQVPHASGVGSPTVERA